MTLEEIFGHIASCTLQDVLDLNTYSGEHSQYGAALAPCEDLQGDGLQISTGELSEALDGLTASEMYDLNCLLSANDNRTLVADCKGVKPQGPRPGRP